MSYILILKDEEDQTSNFVIDWLTSKGHKYISLSNRVLGLADLMLSNANADVLLQNEDYQFRFSEIISYWHRRGDLVIADGGIKVGWLLEKTNYLLQEQKTLTETLRLLLYTKHGLGQLGFNETNKLYNLYLASQMRLAIPITSSSNYKKVLEKTLRQGRFCTKAIRQGWYSDGSVSYNGPTKLVIQDDINKLDDITWPSLLQEYQDKRYELRIFYLDGDFYTSAIFSQNDEQTKVDFRNYNNARPNRTPPYKLPQHIEGKLHRLMQKLTIKCGSIDMVVNTKNEFVFLEVNPFGQFQQVSFPCNYYLELKVAEYLTKYDQKEKTVR
jgi:ATP-GRASP peptide maturase of grasp-with-spasm system